MDSEKDTVVSEYENKLKELYALITNPVGLTQPAEKYLDNKEAQDFLTENSISTQHSVSLHGIKGMESAGSVYHLIKNLSGSLLGAEDNPLKRKNPDSHDGSSPKLQKSITVDFPSRLMPATKSSTGTGARSKNSQAQIKTLELKANEFLNKDIADLEVISLPENFPTEVHNVMSLAEFYYLTQTLPLIKLLPGSHKTLLTENFESALLEGKIAVLHSRIEELKRQKKWSLRQPVRYYDPFLYARKNKTIQNHTWDNVLQEGNWMATDFKESLKFKKGCCYLMAQAVQDYWTYGKIVCVKTKPVVHLVEGQSTELAESLPAAADGKIQSDAMDLDDAATVNEADSREDGGPDEVTPREEAKEAESIDVSKLLEQPNPSDEILPHDLPEISAEDLESYGLGKEPRGPFKAHINLGDLKKIDQSIIKTLPKFSAFKDSGASNLKGLTSGETSIVPVSRMLHPFEDDNGWHKIILKEFEDPSYGNGKKNGLPEFQKGLFGVQSHRRINYLRPPKPPLIKNIEYRSPTIWLPQDDKYLIHYVAEYCFNWDLIAENLSANSATLKKYESNIERRTPWQCFERYIQLNEKFQFSDMKGHNSYSAQQWLEHAHKAQSTTKRRISPLGVGNDSIQRGHRRLRWASMFDAMRKSMRKRETAAAKSNSRRGTNPSDFSSLNSGNNSSSFATNGNNAVKRDRIPTPTELSKLKFDRDKSIQEAYLNQQATKMRMAAAVNQQKNSGSPISGQSSSVGAKDSPGGVGPAGATGRRMSQIPSRQGLGVTGVSTQRSAGILSAQRPAGIQSSPPMSAQTQQQQQQQQAKQLLGNLKRPTSPNGTPYTVEQIQRLLQLQKQRRLIQQQNQTGKEPAMQTGSSSLPGSVAGQKFPGSSANQMPSQSFNSAGLASTAGAPLVGQQGASTGMMQGKRAAAPPKNRIQFAPAQVSAIINSIQQKNPNLTKDQVTKLAASYLANLQQQQNKLDQQQQVGRPSSAGDSSARAQQNFQTRQAQMARQRLAAQSNPGSQGKELDGQTLSRLQYEERKKLMMQQGGSQFGKSGKSSQNYTGSSPNPGMPPNPSRSSGSSDS